MTTGTRHEAHDRLLAEVRLTRRRLEPLRERAEQIGGPMGTELAGHGTELGERCEALQQKVMAWTEVEVGVPTTVADLAAEVDAFEADLDAAAPVDAPGYEVAVDRQVRAWRSIVERLRVQTALGAMNLRDDLEGLTSRLDRVRGDVLVELQNAAADARETVVDLREDVEEVLADARRLVRKVADDLTD
jgi:hypothetical protein